LAGEPLHSGQRCGAARGGCNFLHFLLGVLRVRVVPLVLTTKLSGGGIADRQETTQQTTTVNRRPTSHVHDAVVRPPEAHALGFSRTYVGGLVMDIAQFYARAACRTP